MATPYVEEFDAECPGPRVIFEAPAQRGRDDLGVAHGRLSIAGDGSGVATRQRHGQGRRGPRARGDACKRLHSRASDVSGAGARRPAHLRHQLRPARRGLSARALAALRRRQRRIAVRLGLDPHRSDPAAAGAVVVVGGAIVGRARNAPVALTDPTAHAEVLALRAAGLETGNYRLTGATLYGAADPKAGAVTSLYRLLDDSRLNHRATATGGILADESAALLRRFFESRR